MILAMLSTDVAVTFNLHLQRGSLRVPVISPSSQTCSRSVAAGGGAAAGIVLLTSAMERASAAAEPIRAGTHHRLINGYSPAKRKHALETKSKLPEAVRVPPHRMLWRFILNCMADAHESAVVEFIEDNKDLALKGEKEYIVAMMSKETPDHNDRKHCQQIIHEVMQLPGGSYGVAQLLRRISRASKTPDGREDLEARCTTSPATLALPAAHALLLLLHSEYLDVDNPGWFWTWQALLALTDVIKDVNPQLLTHALFDDEESCAVCLNTLTEKGHMSSWTQLEPCRSAALQPLPASHHPLTIAYACQALDLL